MAFCYGCAGLLVASPEPVEMPFIVWTYRGPRNHVLDGGLDPPWEGALWRSCLSMPRYGRYSRPYSQECNCNVASGYRSTGAACSCCCKCDWLLMLLLGNELTHTHRVAAVMLLTVLLFWLLGTASVVLWIIGQSVGVLSLQLVTVMSVKYVK